jgi:hypothetical protein
MKHKALFLGATALFVSAVAQAGQIQIGQVIGGVNYGLTNAYVTTHNKDNLVAYQPNLFQNATGISSALPIATSTSALNVTDPTNNGGVAGNTSGVTFALIGDPAQGSTGGTWYSTNTAGQSSITIPIGVMNVDTVWTMLNDLSGSAVTATFYFNSTNSVSGATQVAVNLVDGQEIRSAVLCSNGCASTSSTSLVHTNTNVTATGAPGPITVSTGSISYPGSTAWNPSYTSIPTGQPDAGSTAGTLTLDDQAFQFGNAFLNNNYLVQIVFTEGNTGISSNHFDLTAVTVDSVAATTPEPGTIGLGFAGLLLAVGIARKRKAA